MPTLVSFTAPQFDANLFKIRGSQLLYRYFIGLIQSQLWFMWKNNHYLISTVRNSINKKPLLSIDLNKKRAMNDYDLAWEWATGQMRMDLAQEPKRNKILYYMDNVGVTEPMTNEENRSKQSNIRSADVALDWIQLHRGQKLPCTVGPANGDSRWNIPTARSGNPPPDREMQATNYPTPF